MADQVRTLPNGGWIVIDDTETFVRTLPDGGWLVQEGAAAAGGRIMSSLTRHGGLAGSGGIAGHGGGLAS